MGLLLRTAVLAASLSYFSDSELMAAGCKMAWVAFGSIVGGEGSVF